MKILYVIGQLGRGGAEQQLYYLLKYLRPDACVVSLREGGYWAAPIRKLGVEVIELKRRGRADFGRLFQIVRIIRRYKPDIIHIFIDNPYGLYGRLAAIMTGHQRVIVGERAHPTYTPKWYIWLRRNALNYAVRYVISNSKAALDYLTERMALPRYKAVFIPNGIDLERLAVSPKHEANPALPAHWQGMYIVGTVADISARKNPLLFLQVAEHISERHHNVRFLWVGDGSLSDLMKSECKRRNLESIVIFAGHQLDVFSWLKLMDVFILSSEFEGTPNAVMEAMAAGLPCVVTDAGGSSEIVADGVTGFVVPRGAVEALAECVCLLKDDVVLHQKMGKSARQAIQAYDVHKMVAAYQEIYNNLSSNG